MAKKVVSRGMVLPAGSAAATTSLPESDELTVTIDGLDESGHLRCIYPDGFVKHHTAANSEELASKLVPQLRSHYGMTDVAFSSIPKDLEPGRTFVIKRGE